MNAALNNAQLSANLQMQTQSWDKFSKGRLRAEEACAAGPTFQVAFGQSEPDAFAIFTHDEIWTSSPRVLPPDLKAKFDAREIDLGTLAVVALGPRGAWFARWGKNAAWNLAALDTRDREAFTQQVNAAASQPGQLGGIEGIVDFSFGDQGQAVMIFNRGSNIMWTNVFPPARDFEKTVKQLAADGQTFFRASLAVGGRSAIVLQKQGRAAAWSRDSPHWPCADLAAVLQGDRVSETIASLTCSATQPEFWFAAFIDANGKLRFSANVPDAAVAELARAGPMRVS
ncbi:hypothetical protein FA10DRAFT_288723 [Acaromyces ingoldii]|uniref:Uncharacterized protein n=1 Tax=Acaromyces ingoldii TaxID=215250 RepID=A0A316YFX4_9BASI|nr:hypothetical protein FA10DRAFT_288723 [Acaromyces ingoldii]PWN88031.1 hypothetical protein FA10DRAFT_288723 [Acaromyces ingoldii]